MSWCDLFGCMASLQGLFFAPRGLCAAQRLDEGGSDTKWVQSKTTLRHQEISALNNWGLKKLYIYDDAFHQVQS